MKRRRLLQATPAWALCYAALPFKVLASEPSRRNEHQNPFMARTVEEAVETLYGNMDIQYAPDLVQIGARFIEEGHAQRVRMSVNARLPGAESIAVLASGNPYPLVAVWTFSSHAIPYVSTVIKMQSSSDNHIIALVKNSAGLFQTKHELRLPSGAGCVGIGYDFDKGPIPPGNY